MEWISVDDNSGDDVLSEVLCCNGKDFMLGYLSGGVCDDGEFTLTGVTHWLIPEPPA